MSNDIRLVIDTLGNEPGCVILSISASNGLTHFHARIDIEDSCKQGLIIEPRAAMWMMDLPATIRNQISLPGSKLFQAMKELINTFDWDNSRVWLTCAGTEVPIIKTAMKNVGLNLPWQYYAERDFRTLQYLIDKDSYETIHVEALNDEPLARIAACHTTLMNAFDYLEKGIYHPRNSMRVS